MERNDAESTEALFDIAPPRAEPVEMGDVEKGVRAQVEKLQQDGYVTGHHAGAVALVIRAARDVDQSAGKGAPSGRANLLRVMNEILSELPAPEVQQSDALDRALEAIMAGGEENE